MTGSKRIMVLKVIWLILSLFNIWLGVYWLYQYSNTLIYWFLMVPEPVTFSMIFTGITGILFVFAKSSSLKITYIVCLIILMLVQITADLLYLYFEHLDIFTGRLFLLALAVYTIKAFQKHEKLRLQSINELLLVLIIFKPC